MAQQAQQEPAGVIARPTGRGRFQAEISVPGGTILADEPIEVGGGGTGPTPYELLSAALAACTAMTLKIYAERKGWSLPPFSVEAAHSRGAERDLFTRKIVFEGALDSEQEAKLLEIADKCPVHRTLMRGFEIVTHVGVPGEHLEPEPPESHGAQMEQALSD